MKKCEIEHMGDLEVVGRSGSPPAAKMRPRNAPHQQPSEAFARLEDGGKNYGRTRTANKKTKQHHAKALVRFGFLLSLALIGTFFLKRYLDGGKLPPRVALVYIVSQNDPHTQKQVSEMQEAFQDRFVIVWDNRDEPHCPFVTTSATCVDEVQISQSRRFNFICCGLEKAIMWSIDHTTSTAKQRFDYVWFMEDDVEYSDISELVRIVDVTPSEAHLLYQEDSLAFVDDEWYWGPRVERDMKTPKNLLFGTTPLRNGMFNLFRMSSSLLTALANVYHLNGDSWVYFETMIPTTAFQYGLSTQSWPALQPQREYFLRYRPCYTHLPDKGIYHPAKFRNGSYEECDYVEMEDYRDG